MVTERNGEWSDMGLWPFIKDEREVTNYEPDCPGIK
jgi:hypothetical protein